MEENMWNSEAFLLPSKILENDHYIRVGPILKKGISLELGQNKVNRAEEKLDKLFFLEERHLPLL